jgi:hypothetical protein
LDYTQQPTYHRTLLNKTTHKPALAATLLLIAALMLTNPIHLAQAQTPTSFTSTDQFALPNQNSTIQFALNGSYTKATTQNGTWTFQNLSFDQPKIPYFDLSGVKSVGNLSISAQDCNVTVWIYLNINYPFPVVLLSYYTEGGSTQTVNLGLNGTHPTSGSEWSVVTGDNVFLAEGKEWKLMPDDSLVINPSASGNLTIMHFNYNDPDVQKNLPFWWQHSILILAGVVLAVTVTVAVAVKFKSRKVTPKQ